MKRTLHDGYEALTEPSMRTASLVGLASVPAGFAWIWVFGTGSAVVLLATGMIVGYLYSDRPTPAFRAGMRAGVIAPIPELAVQLSPALLDLWGSSMSTGATIAFSLLLAAVVLPTAWVLVAIFVSVVAFGSGWITDQARTAGNDGVDAEQ